MTFSDGNVQKSGSGGHMTSNGTSARCPTNCYKLSDRDKWSEPGSSATVSTSLWQTTRAGPSGSVQAREHEDRELPAGLVLILDKNRHLGGLAVEQALALLPSGHGGLDPKALAAHFDRRLRVCA